MYLNYYGLSEYPFHVTPDPRFMCWTAQHREALEHVLYGVRERKGFIALTGEVGTGKTTLCRACLVRLGDDVETALVLNPTLTETQFLRAIANDFGITLENKDRLSCLEALNAFLLDRNKAGRNVALFIDEAQNLSSAVMEQVRLLSNLETDRHKLIQIILCGQPELKKRLDRPGLRQLRQRIAVRYRIAELDAWDTARYILHRIAVASNGTPSKVRFSDEAFRMVYSYSKGSPRVINAVADNALLAGYVEQSMVIGEECVRRAIRQIEGDE